MRLKRVVYETEFECKTRFSPRTTRKEFFREVSETGRQAGKTFVQGLKGSRIGSVRGNERFHFILSSLSLSNNDSTTVTCQLVFIRVK